MNKSWVATAVAVGVIGLALARAQAANPIDASITVTPIANVDLAITPTTYAYGQLGVGVSSVTASSLTLTNNGFVNASMTKQITNQSNPAGWTAATLALPAIGLNKYALYVATSPARPNEGNFVDADHLFNGTAANALKGLDGTSVTLTPSAGIQHSVDLWFLLKMPSAVSTQDPREITVTFNGTAL
jgi:hypothetical protein